MMEVTQINDWVGNKNSIYKTLGASNHTEKEREKNDYYATDPVAIDKLLSVVKLDTEIWEPACGEGHLSKRLEQRGYSVHSTDLIDRNYGEVLDFLQCTSHFDGDIVTNPPYKFANEFVKKAIELITPGHKVCMLLKIQFLEGAARKELFNLYPPKYICVFSKRLMCAKNGDFEGMKKGGGSAVCYAWFVWEKGFDGSPTIKWI